MAIARLFSVLAGALRLAAIAATVLVLAGLVGFLTDEVRASSDDSATRITFALDNGQTATRTVDIAQPNPSAAVEQLREQRHSSTRESIDDAGDVLLGPFSWVAPDSAAWVRRVLYSGLALLLYGVAAMVLADRLRRFGDKERRDSISRAEQDAAAERRASGTFASPA